MDCGSAGKMTAHISEVRGLQSNILQEKDGERRSFVRQLYLTVERVSRVVRNGKVRRRM